jgi:hypothetical protein
MLVLERKTDFIDGIRSHWCKWLHGLLLVIKKSFKKEEKDYWKQDIGGSTVNWLSY